MNHLDCIRIPFALEAYSIPEEVRQACAVQLKQLASDYFQQKTYDVGGAWADNYCQSKDNRLPELHRACHTYSDSILSQYNYPILVVYTINNLIIS